MAPPRSRTRSALSVSGRIAASRAARARRAGRAAHMRPIVVSTVLASARRACASSRAICGRLSSATGPGFRAERAGGRPAPSGVRRIVQYALRLRGAPRLQPRRQASSPSARICAASSPAFVAFPIATVATGIPRGIWTIESSESMPPRCWVGIGTPMTGSVVFEASIPGRCAAPPAPAMITRMPRARASSA